MKLIKDLEIVQVDSDGKLIRFTTLDEVNEKIYEVKFHTEKYDQDTKKYIPDKATEERVENTLNELFGVGIDNVKDVVGRFHDVYVYDNFNSFYEVEVVEKFTKELKGKVFTAKITEINDDGNRINVFYEYQGKRYRSKFNYSTFLNKKWYIDEQKQIRAYERFYDTFNIDFKDKDTIIGRIITVKVRDFNGNYYGEILALQEETAA